jgi:hypothetical protein
MSYDETVRETSVSLKRLSEAAEIDGGCVGHIKASVNHEDRASILSATENYVNVREIDIDRCELSVVAVVFPKDEERFVEEFKKIAKNLDWNKDGCIGENSL